MDIFSYAMGVKVGKRAGVIDVEELPKGRYYDIECYFKYGAASESNMTLEALFLDNNYTPAITYYGVEALPETPEVTNMQTANPCHIYIYNNIAYMYGDLGSGNTWATVADVLTAVSGTTITNKGFTSDITAATEVGVYVTYKEDKDPVDGAVYRITTVKETPPEMWLIADGDKTTFSDIAAAEGATLHFYVVDVLPETMEAATQTMFPIYILSDTGVGYISQDGTSASAATVGTLLFGAEGFDKGYTDDVESIDATVESNMGAYCVRGERTVSYSLHYYVDGKWYGGGAGGIVDVEELPVEYKDVDVYARFDASEYYTLLQVLQMYLSDMGVSVVPDLNYYVVDELPTVGKASDFNSLSVVHCYIANNIPYVYGDLGSGNTWVTVSAMMTEMAGMSMSDKGFTSDITTETEAGIYVTYKEGEKPVEGVIYRTEGSGGAQLWFKNGDNLISLDEFLAQDAGGATVTYYVVDSLPSNPQVTSDENGYHVYVLKSTGAAYGSMDGSTYLSIGLIGVNKGWINSLDEITEDGDYALRVRGTAYGITVPNAEVYALNDGEWAALASAGEVASLNGKIATLENDKAALETEIAVKTPSANFTDYAVLTGSSNGIEITDVTDTTITGIKIPNSVTSIGQQAFQFCSGLKSASIPNSVTDIGAAAFSSCGLTSITIPDSVTTLGEAAFSSCNGLTSITIPDSVTSIGMSAFAYCTKLEKANIPSGVTVISPRMFYMCDKLTDITIPNNITKIDYEAFYGCINITSITIPNSVTSIGGDAFFNTAITSVAIPASVTVIGEGAFVSSKLLNVTVDANNTVYHSANNCIIDTRNKDLITGCANSIIPTDGSVTSISSHAFAYCNGLTSIDIPDGVTSIGWWAFFLCDKLKSVTIPDSVTSIGRCAFYDCRLLTSIVYSGTKAQWKSIAFGDRWHDGTGNYIVTCTDGTIAKDGTET